MAQPAEKPDDIDPVEPARVDQIETPPPARKKVHEHSDRLRKFAQDMGFSESEIASTPSERLWTEVRNTHQILSQERAAGAAFRGTSPPPAAKPPADELEFDHEIEVEGVRRKATAADYDPGLVKVLKENKKRMAELDEKLAKFSEAEGKRTERSRAEVYDAAFEALAPKYAQLFGDKDGEALAGTREMKRRIAVLNLAGCNFEKDTASAIKRKITEAAEELYGTIAPAKPAKPDPYAGVTDEDDTDLEPAPRKRKSRATEWEEEGPLAKPAARVRQRIGKGVEASDRAVAEAMRAKGMDPGPLNRGKDEDDLPE